MVIFPQKNLKLKGTSKRIISLKKFMKIIIHLTVNQFLPTVKFVISFRRQHLIGSGLLQLSKLLLFPTNYLINE